MSVKERIESAPVATIDAKVVLNPGDPLPSARAFLDVHYTQDDVRTLHYHAGVFYAWDGRCYPEADTATIRAELYRFLDVAVRLDGQRKQHPFRPTSTKVTNVGDALKAETNLPKSITAPAWLDQAPDLPASEILACQNGLLHLPTLALMPRTPLFYSHNALTFDYDAEALEPEKWLRFLDDLWPDDPESIGALQEAFGYFLTSDIRQQKLFLLVGPKRSGKGTIARVLTGLLGQANVCGPTLSSLGMNFGLAPLIGRQVAVISDARLGGRADQHAIAERLLSVSGEDGLTVDRKFLPPWTGKLPTRFLILTNELPRLADTSGALASRFVVLTLTKSFYGREDHDLTGTLLAELSGILNWAIDGWQRLQERGRFVQPQSSVDAIQTLEDLSSPIGAFIRDRCEVAPGLEVETKQLFDTSIGWCEDQGRAHPGTAQTFGRDLRAVIPGLKTQQRREGDQMVRTYSGVGQKS